MIKTTLGTAFTHSKMKLKYRRQNCEEHFVNCCLDMFGGGLESTSNSLLFSLHNLLSRYQGESVQRTYCPCSWKKQKTGGHCGSASY